MRPVKFLLSFSIFAFSGERFKQASTAREYYLSAFEEAQSRRPRSDLRRGRPESCLSHERPALREIGSSIIFYFLFFFSSSGRTRGWSKGHGAKSRWYPCSGNDAVSKVSRWVVGPCTRTKGNAVRTGYRVHGTSSSAKEKKVNFGTKIKESRAKLGLGSASSGLWSACTEYSCC
ncbi:hypothetical protein J3E68DRAFT_6733 [Trichoderma sp. SZMC 28012]